MLPLFGLSPSFFTVPTKMLCSKCWPTPDKQALFTDRRRDRVRGEHRYSRAKGEVSTTTTDKVKDFQDTFYSGLFYFLRPFLVTKLPADRERLQSCSDEELVKFGRSKVPEANIKQRDGMWGVQVPDAPVSAVRYKDGISKCIHIATSEAHGSVDEAESAFEEGIDAPNSDQVAATRLATELNVVADTFVPVPLTNANLRRVGRKTSDPIILKGPSEMSSTGVPSMDVVSEARGASTIGTRSRKCSGGTMLFLRRCRSAAASKWISSQQLLTKNRQGRSHGRIAQC